MANWKLEICMFDGQQHEDVVNLAFETHAEAFSAFVNYRKSGKIAFAYLSDENCEIVYDPYCVIHDHDWYCVN